GGEVGPHSSAVALRGRGGAAAPPRVDGSGSGGHHRADHRDPRDPDRRLSLTPPGRDNRDMHDAPPSPVRLSEIVATMALVSDLGMGVPMERALRQTVIAQRLADAAGFDGAVRTASYYISLLAWVGCATITSEVSELFGDETELYADMLGADLGGVDMARFALRHLGRGRDPLPRLGMVGRFVLSNGRSVEQVIRSHCEAASNLAEQLELGSDVAHPLLQKFERWDGRGVPGDAREEGLAPAIRLIHLAESVERFWQRGGVQAAARM